VKKKTLDEFSGFGEGIKKIIGGHKSCTTTTKKNKNNKSKKNNKNKNNKKKKKKNKNKNKNNVDRSFRK
jgi:hypothetical protein